MRSTDEAGSYVARWGPGRWAPQGGVVVFVEHLSDLPCACVAKTNVLPSPEPPRRLSFATSNVENQTTRLHAPHIARKDQQVFSAMCPCRCWDGSNVVLLQQMQH